MPQTTTAATGTWTEEEIRQQPASWIRSLNNIDSLRSSIDSFLTPLLRKHAGQVAFPGGAVDNTDATLIAAALREAQEEVAIPPEAVEVIGVLPPVDSVTGFQVTPVVGIIPPDLHYHASQDEVSAVFEMPLAEALRLGRYHPLDIHRRGNDHRVWLSWYQHYFVWGMTAGIIRELALQIGARP